LLVNLYFGGWGLIFSSAMILKIADLFYRIYGRLTPFTIAFQEAIDDLETNRQDYVCMLYENRDKVGDWEMLVIDRIFTASTGSLDASIDQPLWKDLLSFLLAPFMSINQMYGALTYGGDETGFLECGVCEFTRFELMDILPESVTDGETTIGINGNTVTWNANNTQVNLLIVSAGLNLPANKRLIGILHETVTIHGQYYTGKTTGGTHIFGTQGQKAYIVSWEYPQDTAFVEWVGTGSVVYLDQPTNFWFPHVQTAINSWSTGANEIRLQWIVETLEDT